MSQIYKTITSGGPIPPEIPTSFVTDNGTAIPDLNILNVKGLDDIQNNENGIFTRANPNLSNNLEIVLSNRIMVSATTIGATTEIVNVYIPPASSSQTFIVRIVGYDSTNNESSNGVLMGGSNVSGAGAVVVVGTNDAFDESSPGVIPPPGMTATDWDVVTDGAALQISFTGVLDRTIVWVALFEYTQVPTTFAP